MTAGGTAAYIIDQGDGGAAGTIPTISRYDAGSKSVTTYSGTAFVNTMTNGPLRGGINLTNGIYYYSAVRSSPSNQTVQDIYAFNTNTNTAIGYIGSVTVPSGQAGGNGDIAFDANGNMLIVIASSSTGVGTLFRIPNVPTTAGNAVLTATALATLPANIPENGIAFDGNGYLYVSTASSLYKLNPNPARRSARRSPSRATPRTSPILANCVVNGSLSLQKNIGARANSGDQFNLSITGGSVSSGNTGTTSGATTGQQTDPSATAGPVIGIFGTTYTLTETAAGTTSLANYTTTMSCIDQANGNAAVTTTQVTATSYTLVFPKPATASTRSPTSSAP